MAYTRSGKKMAVKKRHLELYSAIEALQRNESILSSQSCTLSSLIHRKTGYINLSRGFGETNDDKDPHPRHQMSFDNLRGGGGGGVDFSDSDDEDSLDVIRHKLNATMPNPMTRDLNRSHTNTTNNYNNLPSQGQRALQFYCTQQKIKKKTKERNSLLLRNIIYLWHLFARKSVVEKARANEARKAEAVGAAHYEIVVCKRALLKLRYFAKTGKYKTTLVRRAGDFFSIGLLKHSFQLWCFAKIVMKTERINILSATSFCDENLRRRVWAALLGNKNYNVKLRFALNHAFR